MKTSSLALPTVVTALLTATVFTVGTFAQTPQSAQPAGGPPRAAPTNLKVLPKNLTGDQVHEIMEKWAGSLGVHCGTCHTADPNNIGPNGRPRLNFADDSTPEKATARVMYKMTEDINQNYISKIENSGEPVTCGTCHRGHLGPEPFVIPPEEHGPPLSGPAPSVSK